LPDGQIAIGGNNDDEIAIAQSAFQACDRSNEFARNAFGQSVWQIT